MAATLFQAIFKNNAAHRSELGRYSRRFGSLNTIEKPREDARGRAGWDLIL
jgi:hypothetical protein